MMLMYILEGLNDGIRNLANHKGKMKADGNNRIARDQSGNLSYMVDFISSRNVLADVDDITDIS